MTARIVVRAPANHATIMSDVSIFDPLTPYFFAGVDLGAGVHDILALLHIDELEAVWDDDAVVLWGIARIDSDDPNSFAFSPKAGGGPVNPGGGNRQEVWEWHDLSVQFRLTVPRQATQVLPASSAITNDDLRSLLQAFGVDAAGTRSDYPGTQFRLELLLNLITITIPGLTGAKLEPNGVLVADDRNPKVKLKLPRILLIVEQGNSGPDTPFNVRVASWGATGFDGQSEEIVSVIEMMPPYALVGSDNKFGFAFRSLVVDLDDSHTPPELLDKFGIGEDWQGVYLPEVRIFIAPGGLTGFAVNAGVRELLIGIGNTPGVWGDFIADVINQGDALNVELRLYDELRNPLVVELLEGGNGKSRYVAPAVPEDSSMLIDIRRGAAPYTIKAVLGLDPDAGFPDNAVYDGTTATDLSVTMAHHLTAVVRSKIAVRITSRNPTQRRELLIDVHPSGTAASLPPGSGASRVRPVRFGTAPTVPPTHSITIDGQDDNSATLRISPAQYATVTVGGTAATMSDERVRVPVAREGTTVPFSVTWTEQPGLQVKRLHCYFQFAKPSTVSTTTPTSASRNPADGSRIAESDLRNFLSQLPPGATVRIDGYASHDGTPQVGFNRELSRRRAETLAELLANAQSGGLSSAPQIFHHGYDLHPLSGLPPNSALIVQLRDPESRHNISGLESWRDTNNHTMEARSYYWRATASYTRTSAGSPVVASGTLTRDAPSTPERRPPPDIQPPAANRPDFLRSIGATVRILQSEFVALELRGTVDFHTATERGLEQFRGNASELPNPPIPARTNPDDGVVDFRLNISHDDATNIWTERLLVKAGESDRDGLISWGSIPTNDSGDPPAGSLHFGRDLLGLYFTMAPLLAAGARDEPDAGDIVALTAGLALPPVLAGLNVVRVLQWTLYGVELSVKHHGVFEDGKVALMFDVESALWFNLKFGDNFRVVVSRPDKPVKVRYKAIGFTINAGFDDTGPFVPVFDSSKGYTIDLADSGSLKILPDLPGPLGDIIQLAGARIARTNPLNLEVELALGVDLGVFSVDKIGFRLPIDPLGAPTLTSLGVGIEIPNVIIGRGALTIREDGFSGAVDVSLPSVGLRIAAALAVSSLEDPVTARTATGVFLSLVVELPVGIPLGGTGMGIFGFLGLFAMHYARREPAEGNDKALRWLRDPPVSGDPTKIEGWGPALDKWAFGVGIMLGTMEGAYVIRMTGMLALELPGPRLLFFLKASLINTKPPGNVKSETGTLVAVLDISPSSLLVGIQVDYKIDPILQIMIPVEGFFGFDDVSNFYVHIGSIARPITAKVFEVFKATAYLMIAGKGIPDFPLGALQGFSVAAGFHVSLSWGYRAINLYLEVAAGFDAGIGFSPFFIAGRIYLRGELHLFIISLEARAELEAQSDGKDTWVYGSVCGRIDLFFFELEGCVSFELGTKPGTPHAPALLRGLALQSRSPALIRGTAIDRGVDTVLCRGTTDRSVPRDDDGNELYVPIDAVPIVQMEVAPELAAGFTIVGDLNGRLPGGNDGWRKRGEVWIRYRLKSVELGSPGVTTPVTPGDRPNTWREVPIPENGDAAPIDLALLDWCPTSTPKAFEASKHLDAIVDDRYRDLCRPIAKAVPVLWTFQRSPIGFSSVGWSLDGEAWPDVPGTVRTQEVATRLRVVETWRPGSTLDALRSVTPAVVLGTLVTCPPKRRQSEIDPDVGAKSRLDSLRRPTLSIKRRDPFADVQSTQPLVIDRGELDALIDRTAPIKAVTDVADREALHLRLFETSTMAKVIETPTARLPSATSRVAATASLLKPGSPLVRGLQPRIVDAMGAVPVRREPTLGPVEAEAEVLRQPIAAADTSSLIKDDEKASCRSRILIAPFESDVADKAPAELRQVIDSYLRARFEHELADVVRFEGGPFVEFRCLMALRGELIEPSFYDGGAFDRDGNPIAMGLRFEFPASAAEFPPHWIDPQGPWFEDVFLGTMFLQRLSGALQLPQAKWRLAIVTFKLAKPAYAIEFGVRPLGVALEKLRRAYPAYAVAVMEGLGQAEVQREIDDESEAADDRAGLEAALDQDPAERALLLPGRRYDVTTTYAAEVGELRDDGMHVIRDEESFTRVHTFYTDANPPARLSPWVLCQFPSPEERYHFYEDPIVLVFGTDDVTQMFGAYGRNLRGVVRDASFRPPTSSPLLTKVATLLIGSVLQKIGGVVFSPWEASVRRLLEDRPCGEFNPSSPRHERAVLGLHMESSSEYVFDVEAVPKSGGSVSPASGDTMIQPLYRERLATSRYRNREAMAHDVSVSYIAARRLPDPAPLTALAEHVSDQALDEALIAAGIGVGERATGPRVTVLWRDGAPPRPVVIYIETPEPLWRHRLEPEVRRDDDGRVIAWELVSKLWLYVDELVATGGGAPGPVVIEELPFIRRETGTRVVHALTIPELRDKYLRLSTPTPASPSLPSGVQVTRLVRDSSGCRTLALLGPNARGRTVSLGLVRNLNPLIDLDTSDDPVPLIDVYLERAPWEDSP